MFQRQGVFAVVGVLLLFTVLHFGFSSEAYGPQMLGPTLLGGVAFLLMTMVILLSTRAPALENLFGGLDRLYQVHRVMGVLTALIVLVHFFFGAQLDSG
ncbi:ferric reductase-like transmembrane domain-containing protein [Ramlibacter sp. H39-3-26]|uniref:ferric reductase-like transmembrane domain-containing protein n=1 Tax=Curvibacter soli TaxID=3031331 RepID=UPI0023DAFE96|nr:ferric reductase-like transmembrane domain-containing protein [Ramlibacter sp. H39-3-26]MDF1486564.1 ferric reductase-like transmembrane domain-containing protein [Ramlibacter sp. H39-3-26]